MNDRKLILVVDSDPEFVASVRALLSHHRTLSAADVMDADEIVASGRVDAVVLGPSLANPLDLAAFGEMRRSDPSIAVVLCTDLVTNRLLLLALRAGLTDIIDLPLTDESFAAWGAEVELIFESAATELVEPGSIEEIMAEFAVPRELDDGTHPPGPFEWQEVAS